MKKLCVLVVLCLVWITPAVSQTKPDKERDELVGPVKSVKAYLTEFFRKDTGVVEQWRRPSYFTTYNTEGNISTRDSYERSGAIVERLVYTYDANGRSTGYKEYPALLDKNLTVPRHHVYNLDEEGRRVEYTVFETNGSIASRCVYKYDAKGNLIEEQWFTHTGKLSSRMVSTFDEQGNQTSQMSYGESGALNWKTFSKYDANGNKTEWIQYYGNTLKSKTFFSYDSKGRILERKLIEFNKTPGFFPNAPLPGKVVYTYDDDKRTKEEATYEADGTLRLKLVHTYDERKNEIGVTALYTYGSHKLSEAVLINIEYDSHGNWTRKTRLTQKDGPPQVAQEELRVITYY